MLGVRFSHPLLRMKLLHRLCGSFFHDIGKYELSYITLYQSDRFINILYSDDFNSCNIAYTLKRNRRQNTCRKS